MATRLLATELLHRLADKIPVESKARENLKVALQKVPRGVEITGSHLEMAEKYIETVGPRTEDYPIRILINFIAACTGTHI